MMRKDLPDLHVNIAECLLKTEKPQEALISLEKAEALDPKFPKLFAIRADVYTKLGDVDNARRNYEAYMEVDNDSTILSQILTLPGYDPDDAMLERLEEIANSNENEAGRNVFYANIASVYEKRKNYPKAFELYQKSNARIKLKLDRKGTLAAFSNLKETFTREFMESHANLGHESDQPIFIVGMPRSGTTLTESILAGHPSIIDNGELSYMHSRLGAFGLYTENNPLLNDMLPTFKKFFDDAPDDHFKSIAQGYFDNSGFDKRSKAYQVDKLPHNFMAVAYLHLVFPNAKIIHCRRNPIDGALSCFKASFSEFHAYATDLEFLGLYYRQYWELMKYWRELLPGKMFEVYYEDTVSNTEFVARNMIDHVGLEWDDGCLDHTKSKKTVSTASQWQVRQPIYTSSVAKWKNYEKELQPLIRTLGTCVEEYEAELAALSQA
jgi:tetratricopeptide (TPR) repeat protein